MNPIWRNLWGKAGPSDASEPVTGKVCARPATGGSNGQRNVGGMKSGTKSNPEEPAAVLAY